MVAYRKLDDLQSIVANRIPEGVSLEYKASEVFTKNRVPNLCKTVTALANSAGGQFIIGIDEKDHVPIKLDGGVPMPSRRDWVHQVVSANTFPPVESFEVFEIPDAASIYYVIDVPASSKAPHQYDGRYYKRRGPHSEVMEHYEIEDVRGRAKGQQLPLLVELRTAHDVLLLLQVRNSHPTESLFNLKFSLEENFNLDKKGGVERLCDRGLRSLRPMAALSYHLDSAITILQQSPEAELTVRVEYTFAERVITDTFVLFIGDLMSSAILRSEEVEAVRKLTDKLGEAVRELQEIRRASEPLLQMVDGSGLRLSHRTISSLKNRKQRFDPTEFSAAGYQIFLDISREEAFKLAWMFKERLGGISDLKERYEKLPKSLRKKFERVFKVSFEQD